MLHQLLGKLADAIAVYVRYQIDCGAQVVQMFDSWAGQLSPQDYETFALPYQQRVFQQVRQTHPDTPLILLVSGSAGLLERMAKSGADIVTVDWTVDMAEARVRLGKDIKVQEISIQEYCLVPKSLSAIASMTLFVKLVTEDIF